MKKIEFRSFNGGYLAFTEDSVIVSDNALLEARVFPLGSIKSISSASAFKIVTHSGETCVVPMRHMHKKSKLKIKELTAQKLGQLNTAEKQEPYSIEFDDEKRARINKMHVPRKSNKKIMKFWAITAIILCSLIILTCLVIGFMKSHASDTPQNPNAKLSWELLW